MLARLAFCCTLLVVSTSAAAQPAIGGGAQGPTGAAPAPSARPVELSGTLAQQGELAWTLTLDEANGPGEVRVGPAAATPGGEVCTLSNETLSATTSGPVLTRIGADGTVQWRHPLLASSLTFTILYDVAASGEGCVAVLRPPSLPRSRLLVVGANADGVAWSSEVQPEGSDETLVDALAASDEAGNVWVVTQPESDLRNGIVTHLVRFDVQGMQTTAITFQGSEEAPDALVTGLATLSDGRAVLAFALSDLLLLIADSDGNSTVVERSTSFLPFTLAVIEDEVVLAGTDSGLRQIAVRRLALDGTERWTTNLSTELPSFFLPNIAVALSTDAIYVGWGLGFGRISENPARLTRLRLDDGTEQWQRVLSEDVSSAVEGLRANEDGAMIWTNGTSPLQQGSSALASFDTEGTLRWSLSSPTIRSAFGARTLIPCANGAVCLVAQRFDSAVSRVSNTWTVEAYDSGEEPRWTQTRVAAPSAVYELHDTALAPSDGTYLFGTTRTEEGGRDLLVARVTPEGTLLWASAVDGGATDDTPKSADFGIKPSGSLSVSANGDVLVSGTAVDVGDDGEGRARALVARLAPDGTARWVRRLVLEPESTNQFAGSVVDDGAGGAALPVLVDDLAALTVEVVRLDANGDIDWATLLTDSEPYPLGFHRTPNGYALASLAFSPIATRVYRFSETGTLASTTSTASRPECGEVGGEFEVVTGADASGTLHVVGRSIGGDEPCRGPAVFRFRLDGTVEFTRLGTVLAEPAEIQVRDDGTTLVGYNDFDDVGRLLRIAPDGAVLWDESVAVEVRGVALGSGVGALAVGPTRDDAAPLATAYVPDGGATAVPLDDLGGLATTPRTALVADDGTGYVGLDAEAFGIGLVGLARIDDALPVTASQDKPQPNVPLLARLGPNPLRAGAPLRLTLGAPSDLALYDVLGRRVAAWDALPPGEFEATLPARLAAGLYVLRAEGEDTAATLRVTVLQ